MRDEDIDLFDQLIEIFYETCLLNYQESRENLDEKFVKDAKEFVEKETLEIPISDEKVEDAIEYGLQVQGKKGSYSLKVPFNKVYDATFEYSFLLKNKEEIEVKLYAKNLVEKDRDWTVPNMNSEKLNVKVIHFDLKPYVRRFDLLEPHEFTVPQILELFPFNLREEPLYLPPSYVESNPYFLELPSNPSKMYVLSILPRPLKKPKPLRDSEDFLANLLIKNARINSEEEMTLGQLFERPTLVFCCTTSIFVFAPFTNVWKNFLKHRNLCSLAKYFDLNQKLGDKLEGKIICSGHMTAKEGSIVVDILSGTFQPKDENLVYVKNMFQVAFPTVEFVYESEMDVGNLEIGHPDAPKI